jgi:hypothetical protein
MAGTRAVADTIPSFTIEITFLMLLQRAQQRHSGTISPKKEVESLNPNIHHCSEQHLMGCSKRQPHIEFLVAHTVVQVEQKTSKLLAGWQASTLNLAIFLFLS